MLRGGFGHAFRCLCCIPQCRDARTCPVGMSCPYKAIFEPSPPPEAEALSKNQDIPRPFVFRAPKTQQTRFETGQPFEFGLVLIGRALDFLPYFVLSFRELAGEGLGLNRAVCELENVIACDFDESAVAGVYQSSDQMFHTPAPLDLAAWVEQRMRQLDPSRITVRFLTPT